MSLRGSTATAAGSTARPPFGALTRATSPVSSGESTPGRVNYRALLSPIVILTASEISHNQSEEYMPVSSSVGFFTNVQNDVFFASSFGVDSPVETGEMSR